MSLFSSLVRRLVPTLLVLACASPCLAQNNVRGPAQPPVPMQILDRDDAAAPKAGAKAAAPQPKFPNKDTAKNRQDYEMGTDNGADSIQLGRDETTGDTVMRHTPPKKAPQKQPFEDQPIQVRPVVPVWR